MDLKLDKGMIKKFKQFEGKSDELAEVINSGMIKIDDSMSYKDFAVAVSKVLKEEYGEHNYEPFIDELMKQLM